MPATCTLAGFIEAGNCLKDFDKPQQRAIAVYQLTKYLVGAGGYDYTGAGGDDQLLLDSTTATRGLSDSDRRAAFIGILNQEFTGIASLLLVNTVLTKATAEDAIACYKNWTPNQLEGAQLFLLCAILALAV